MDRVKPRILSDASINQFTTFTAIVLVAPPRARHDKRVAGCRRWCRRGRCRVPVEVGEAAELARVVAEQHDQLLDQVGEGHERASTESRRALPEDRSVAPAICFRRSGYGGTSSRSGCSLGGGRGTRGSTGSTRRRSWRARVWCTCRRCAARGSGAWRWAGCPTRSLWRRRTGRSPARSPASRSSRCALERFRHARPRQAPGRSAGTP